MAMHETTAERMYQELHTEMVRLGHTKDDRQPSRDPYIMLAADAVLSEASRVPEAMPIEWHKAAFEYLKEDGVEQCYTNRPASELFELRRADHFHGAQIGASVAQRFIQREMESLVA